MDDYASWLGEDAKQISAAGLFGATRLPAPWGLVTGALVCAAAGSLFYFADHRRFVRDPAGKVTIMNNDEKAKALVESLLEADQEVRARFLRHPQFNPRDMDSVRRDAYLSTVKLWQSGERNLE